MDPEMQKARTAAAPRKRAPRKTAARNAAAPGAALTPEEEAIAAQLAPEPAPMIPAASAPAAPSAPAAGFRIRKRTLRRALRAAGAIVILLALLFAARVFHWGGWGLTQEEADAQQVAAVVRDVSTLMYLPDETPQVAAVVDPSKLAGQPFFANAEAGDEVLAFVHAGTAILYRPSTHRIVNVAPLVIQPNATTSSQ